MSSGARKPLAGAALAERPVPGRKDAGENPAPRSTLPIVDCAHQRLRCTATASDGGRWILDVHSEAEAESMARAIRQRGYILPDYWRPAP